MTFEALLVTGATWALVLGAGWAVLVCAAAGLEVVSDGRLALTIRLGCPAPARRALLAGLGVVLAGGGALVAGPSSAAPVPSQQPIGSRTGVGPLALPVPARPTGAAGVVPSPRIEVVRPGDSLWHLAQQRSGRRASTQDVARLVERTYRANRGVIGPDPDLIRPGQRLHVPVQRRHTPPPLEAP